MQQGRETTQEECIAIARGVYSLRKNNGPVRTYTYNENGIRSYIRYTETRSRSSSTERTVRSVYGGRPYYCEKNQRGRHYGDARRGRRTDRRIHL